MGILGSPPIIDPAFFFFSFSLSFPVFFFHFNHLFSSLQRINYISLPIHTTVGYLLRFLYSISLLHLTALHLGYLPLLPHLVDLFTSPGSLGYHTSEFITFVTFLFSTLFLYNNFSLWSLPSLPFLSAQGL